MAEIIKVPAANLVATVERYNKFVDQGNDEDFGMFKKALKQKIEAGPFYAMPKTYYPASQPRRGAASTSIRKSWIGMTGLSPGSIPRGEITGNLHGWERNGGCGWTDCVVFGRIAGRKAAAEKAIGRDILNKQELA